MEREKIKPNGITFISVLSACTHTGLVEEGRRMFLSMTDDYSILPEVGHYGCMVDLLSKAGMLKDALELIRSMEVEPNNIIWGALLGGCKLHRNLGDCSSCCQGIDGFGAKQQWPLQSSG